MADQIIDKAAGQIAEHQSKPPTVRAFFDEATYTASYVVRDPASKKAAIIDSVLDYDPASGRTSTESADKVLKYVRQQDLEIEWLLETHAHADHLTAAPYLQYKLGGKIAIGREITKVQDVFAKLFNVNSGFAHDGSHFDQLFNDGDQFFIGDMPVIALHVPGHTPADLAYVVGNVVFVGDTLFMPDYGTARADFPGGDAKTLYQSIRRLLSLPPDTKLFMCHDYQAEDRDYYAWESTVQDEKEENIHVHDGVSEEEFVRMRTARDKTLDMPRLILPSVQVNMRAGHFPELEDNGTRYLKIPLDKL